MKNEQKIIFETKTMSPRSTLPNTDKHTSSHLLRKIQNVSCSSIKYIHVGGFACTNFLQGVMYIN